MPNDDSNVLTLAPAGTDQAKAEDLRARMRAALAPVCLLMDEAIKEGFVVQLGLGIGPMGKNIPQQILLIRQF